MLKPSSDDYHITGVWLNGRHYMELLKWRIQEDLYQEVDLLMETEEQPSDEDHPAPIAGYFVGPTLPSKDVCLSTGCSEDTGCKSSKE